ncbi:iron-containing alcohol dehydrogenase [Cloacibacillus sp. An23]|uniref:iron-containing alcohol dehydrogenase n=1 Tax=Cloacibacillus sp. An23 TaxID=1965591 RepID=UPI000B36EE00|nr:iron-containing alcohol dehydrogenase [Cloacibacillus sp. An23]OUO92841.1 alcohol dehydrogenase [Cloacibacillus sp. An23]
MQFSFTLPTKIVFGSDACFSIADELKKLGCISPLIITDKGIINAGICDVIEAVLRKHDVRYAIYSDVDANPKDVNVMNGAQMAVAFKADSLIAIGGGSPIDCAKAIDIVASHGGKIRDYEGYNTVKTTMPPIIAIPTTAGTGSEVTFGTVITDTKDKRKFSIRHVSLAPKVALCDPNLTKSLPERLTAFTGMDALTHAIEGYVSLVHEPIADACALHAIRMISNNITRAVEDGGDIEARSAMLIGSVLAAIAFSHSDVASVHCLAEAMGGLYDLPHGLCNAVLLAPIMKYNISYCERRYADIAAALGCVYTSDIDGARQAVNYVEKLAKNVGLPPFTSIGISEKDIDAIAGQAAINGSNLSNPRPMKKEDYVQFLRSLF